MPHHLLLLKELLASRLFSTAGDAHRRGYGACMKFASYIRKGLLGGQVPEMPPKLIHGTLGERTG